MSMEWGTARHHDTCIVIVFYSKISLQTCKELWASLGTVVVPAVCGMIELVCAGPSSIWGDVFITSSLRRMLPSCVQGVQDFCRNA